VGGVAEMVEDGKTGLLVPPGDLDAIAEALHRILSDPGFAASLGAAGKALALRSYRADVVARRTREVYEGMVGA
jgi:glycosyltransferase involved in cell wall biosynthesis